MTTRKTHVIGSLALGLSLLIFMIYFINFLIGGPFGQKFWMSDVGEMLTLFLVVVFFVAGTIAREADVDNQLGPVARCRTGGGAGDCSQHGLPAAWWPRAAVWRRLAPPEL